MWTMRTRWFNYYHRELEWIRPEHVIASNIYLILSKCPDDDGELFDIVYNKMSKQLFYTLI